MLIGYDQESSKEVDISKELETVLMYVLCRELDKGSDYESGQAGRWNAYPLFSGAWGTLRIPDLLQWKPQQIKLPKSGLSFVKYGWADSEAHCALYRISPTAGPKGEKLVGVQIAWFLEAIHIDECTKSTVGATYIGWGPKIGWAQWDGKLYKWFPLERGNKAISTIRGSYSMSLAFDPLWRARVILGGVELPSIDIPLQDLEAARTLLQLRDTIPGQRRKALLHWVREHYRRKPSEGLTTVQEHLRGIGEEIKVDDFLVSLQPASISVSKFKRWKESRSRRHHPASE